MTRVEIGECVLYHGDCLEVLPALGSGSVDAVVTDPPYGIKADARQSKRADKKHGNAKAASRNYGISNWDNARPDAKAFEEMSRVSKEQVIFGGNYFTDVLRPSPSWFVWDKDNGTNGYADFELAWTSHKRAARKARWRWHGMLQESGHPKDDRVHPTQKPVGLMVWVLEEYAPSGGLVLDPFMGSGTTGVACVKTGRRFIGIEKERKYYDIACRRIREAYESQALYAEGTP